jgi:hypothetical protein
MHSTRRLALRREALTELSTDELHGVIGAGEIIGADVMHTLDTCLTCQTSINTRCDA